MHQLLGIILYERFMRNKTNLGHGINYRNRFLITRWNATTLRFFTFCLINRCDIGKIVLQKRHRRNGLRNQSLLRGLFCKKCFSKIDFFPLPGDCGVSSVKGGWVKNDGDWCYINIWLNVYCWKHPLFSQGVRGIGQHLTLCSHFPFLVMKDLKYADTHEWVKVEGDSATVGITDHAQVNTFVYSYYCEVHR